ncbi:MAG: aminotransferase class V-fold PLP-dependent enzyme [Clostridium sp.]
MNIYLDNASTTFPKPKVVVDAMCNFITNIGGNSGRSNHSNSLNTNRILYNTRELLCDFFNFDSAQNVIFTNNITTSLNVLINGVINSGDHIITSSMEHNSVIRPLYKLKNELNIEIDIIQASIDGFIDPTEISKLIKSNTKLIVLSQASNVTGSIQPIKKIGQICKDNKIFFILDSAQGAGVLKTDFQELNLSALAFTGHKSLFGPQGTGGFIIDNTLNEICRPLIVGGTGSLSDSLYQPHFLPDKFESGTLNMPGIVGLYESVNFIKSQGLQTIYDYNKKLHSYFINELLNIDTIDFYGDKTGENSTTCVAFNIKNMDTSELSFELDNTYGIKNRSGLHCSPLAHKTIGSYPTGAVRLSLSYFNKKSEIDYTLKAISSISRSIL